MKKSRRKIFFSGISESTQANFSWALIFWSFFIQVVAKRRSAYLFGGKKGHKQSLLVPSKIRPPKGKLD